MRALAYHITWGTYGTRLRYGPRPTVSRDQNDCGAPVLRYDEHLWEREKSNLKHAPVFLTREQMIFVEAMVPIVCERGGWHHRTSAAGPDHVHVVLTSEHDPETIRRLLKRWTSQLLAERYPNPSRPGSAWWAECGSIRWVGDPSYLTNALNYVAGQRATPPG